MDIGSLLVPILCSSFKACPVKKMSITLLNGSFYRCYTISTIFRIFHMKEKKNSRFFPLVYISLYKVASLGSHISLSLQQMVMKLHILLNLA